MSDHTAPQKRVIWDGNPWGQQPSPIEMDGLPYIMGALVAEVLLYGIHVILFTICVHVLVRRSGRKHGILRKVMLLAVTTSFILATGDIAVSINLGVRDIDQLIQANTIWFVDRIYPKFLLHLVNNMIADILLVIRFYVVWRRKRAIIIPGLVIAMGTGFGIYSEGTPRPKPTFIWIYIGTILVTNIVLTLLISGRIFWISWKARRIIGPHWVSQYNTVVAVLIESGFLYSISTIALMILSRTKFIFIGATITIRMVCLVPLLIIVQIALGRAAEDLQTTLSMAQRDRPSTVILDTIATMDSSYPEEHDENAASQVSAEESKVGQQESKIEREGQSIV